MLLTLPFAIARGRLGAPHRAHAEIEAGQLRDSPSRALPRRQATCPMDDHDGGDASHPPLRDRQRSASARIERCAKGGALRVPLEQAAERLWASIQG